MTERLPRAGPCSNEENRLTRRQFLYDCLLEAAALMLASCQRGKSAERQIESAKKFLLITDVHIGERSTIYQANAEALKKLKYVLKLVGKNNFDHIFQLGDMIVDTPDEEKNASLIRNNLAAFDELECEQTHLLGNHDVVRIGHERLKREYREAGQSDQFYGLKVFPDFQVVWLDLIATLDDEAFLPDGRIDWLREEIHPDTPTIIFVHKPLVKQWVEDNHYFKRKPEKAVLVNGPEAWKAIRHLPVRAIVGGDLHMPVYRKVDNTHMINLPAFSERRPPSRENPGVYTIFKANADCISSQSFRDNTVIFDINV